MSQLIPVVKHQYLTPQKAGETLLFPVPGAAAAAAVQHRPLTAPLPPKSRVRGAARATLAKNHRVWPRHGSDTAGSAPCSPRGRALQGSGRPQPPSPPAGAGEGGMDSWGRGDGFLPCSRSSPTQGDTEPEGELVSQPWPHPASHQVYTHMNIPEEHITTSTADDTSCSPCFDFVTQTGKIRFSLLTWKKFYW